MKVRIVSTDGIPYNVQIWEHQTGEVIESVVAAFIHPFNVHSREITGEITVLATSIDVVCDVDVNLHCPYCNHQFPVEVDDPIHTAVAKQDAENQVHMEDHLSKATWPYGEQQGMMLHDAVQQADAQLQDTIKTTREKLEKAYTDVQKMPVKRLTRTELLAMEEEYPGS